MTTATTTLNILLLLALSASTLAGCSDSNTPDEPMENDCEGDCHEEDTSEQPPPADGSDASDDPPPPAAMEYAGSWTLYAEYEVHCIYFANDETKAVTFSRTMNLEGDNDDLVVNDAWHQLIGSGDEDRLSLGGSFPLDGVWDHAAPGKDTNLTFDGYDVSSDEVSGSVSGDFRDDAGADCEILEGGTFELTR